MTMLCSNCVDKAVKDGTETYLEATQIAAEAVSVFPVLSVAQTPMGTVANFLAIPLCYECRKRESTKSKTGLVTA